MKKFLTMVLLLPLLFFTMNVGHVSAASVSDQLKKVNKDLQAAETKYKAADKKYKTVDAKYQKAIVTGEIVTYEPRIISGKIAGQNTEVLTQFKIENPVSDGTINNVYTGYHYFKSSTTDASGNAVEVYGDEPADVKTAKKAVSSAKSNVTKLKDKKVELTALKAGNKYKKYTNGHYVGKLNKKGQEHGKGTLKWSNGDKYVGTFKDGHMYGKGTYTWKNGNKYVGDVKRLDMDGTGKLYHTIIPKRPNPDGTWTKAYYQEVYSGTFKKNMYDGKGTLIYKPSAYFTTIESFKYTGEFKGGKFNGYGIYEDLRTGEILKGTWENNELIVPDLG